jgi:hypothetical protein
MSPLLLALTIAAATPARTAVLALSDAPEPPPALVESAEQLRAALRAQDASVLDLPETRARLLRDDGAPSLAQLDREYERAIAAYAIGDYRPAVRALRKLVAQLEAAPEGVEAHAQWLRAALRLAHAELTVGNRGAYRALLERVALVDPEHEADPDQFSPTFRRDLGDARRRVAARRTRTLSVVANGAAGEVFVNGRPMGPPPVRVKLPPGRHRVGGAAGDARVPRATVELGPADETVTLELGVAAAVRADAGPALVAGAGEREGALATVARWLGTDGLVSVRLVTDAVLVGTLHDGEGAVLREGRVVLAGATLPPASAAALSAFLLTGAPSPLVNAPAAEAPQARAAAPDLRVAPPAGSPLAPPLEATARARPRWMKPAAIGSAGLAVGLAAVATQQFLSARSSYDEADALVRPDDGAVADGARYQELLDSGDRAKRNAWIAAGGALVFAATAGVLGYLSWTDAGPVVAF